MKPSPAASTLPPTWLELNDAARVLGVHFTTLRRWADEGQIPHMRTPGGRRRFSQTVLEQFLHEHEQVEARLDPVPAELEQAVLMQMRSRLPVFFERENLPVSALTPQEMQQMRQTGRRLLACLVQFLSEERRQEACLGEARLIAREYGSLFCAIHMNVNQMLRAFLFFRGEILDVFLDAPSSGLHRESNVPLFRRINQFTDEILLEISESYDTEAVSSDSHRGEACP